MQYLPQTTYSWLRVHDSQATTLNNIYSQSSALGIEEVASNARVENDSAFSGVLPVIDVALESQQPDVTGECWITTSQRIMQWFVNLVKILYRYNGAVVRPSASTMRFP